MNKDEMRKILREMSEEFYDDPYDFRDFLHDEADEILKEDLASVSLHKNADGVIETGYTAKLLWPGLKKVWDECDWGLIDKK